MAWHSACDNDTDVLSQPWSLARSASAPLRIGKSLDDRFLGRKAGRQSFDTARPLTVLELPLGENLAQIAVAESGQGLADLVEGHDIAADADAVLADTFR